VQDVLLSLNAHTPSSRQKFDKQQQQQQSLVARPASQNTNWLMNNSRQSRKYERSVNPGDFPVKYLCDSNRFFTCIYRVDQANAIKSLYMFPWMPRSWIVL